MWKTTESEDAALRERAEWRIAREATTAPGDEDHERVLHELRVHQIELEMQRDELSGAKLELERSHAEYQALYDQAPVGYFTCTPRGRILRANATLAELLGTTVGELVGSSFPRFAAAEHRDTFHLHVVSLREEAATSCRMQLVTTAGACRDVQLDSRIDLDDGGQMRGAKVCVIDLTEQRRAEARLRDVTERSRREATERRINKLEAIGVLAGGIAHDFNNLLTGIVGNIALAKSNPAGAAELLTEAQKACVRATALTNQLLTFAKGGGPVKKATSLIELIGEAARFSLHGSNVRLELRLAEDLWSIEADEGQLYNVFQNLTINAHDAMPVGGRLRIDAENVTLADKALPPLPAGDYVHITFSDEGVGIDEPDLERIFDPYFTTKSDGSGLGLASVHSIVQNHNGLVIATSQVGQGTSMHVYLPVPSAPVAARRKPAPKASVASDSQRARVLVVDDEEIIRNVIARSLSSAGIDVVAVAEGSVGLEAYREGQRTGRPYDAVVLDLTIPGGMGGVETIAALRALDPDVCAVVSSGYSDAPVLANPGDYGFVGVVKKPFNRAEICSAVRDAVRLRRGSEGDR